MSHCSMGPPCLPISLIALLATGLLCCKQEAPSTAAPSAPEVEVADVVQKDVPIYSEWVGSTDGMVNAVIKAQVNGYLMKQNYDEGAFVKKGHVLFEIDPRKFQAALDQAKGEWEKARAQFVKTELDVKRDTPLAEGGAISQKELDDSIQANLAAKASVASAKAAVEQAELNLSFSKIIAPIDGVVGIAKAQIGDLVGPGDELASMSTLDPIRVYINRSASRNISGAAEKIRQAYQEGEQNEKATPTLSSFSADGTIYPHKGSLLPCGPAGRCENRNDSGRGAISQPGQSASPRTVWAGAGRHTNQTGSASGSSTCGDGVARRLSGRRRDRRQQDRDPPGQGR